MSENPAYWARVEARAKALGSDGCTQVSEWHQRCCWLHDVMCRSGMDMDGHAVPRADASDDPALRAILDGLATERFGEQYDAERGVVRYATPHERVREGVSPVTARMLGNRHVRFFVERNSEHADGVELACLADVRVMDLARTVARIVRVKTRPMLRDVR